MGQVVAVDMGLPRLLDMGHVCSSVHEHSGRSPKSMNTQVHEHSRRITPRISPTMSAEVGAVDMGPRRLSDMGLVRSWLPLRLPCLRLIIIPGQVPGRHGPPLGVVRRPFLKLQCHGSTARWTRRTSENCPRARSRRKLGYSRL
eukprot:3236996-Rhodomonas_salina.1